MNFRIDILGLCLVVCGLQSCGGTTRDDNWLPTCAASGHVTVNGAPARGAIIRLYPQTPQAGTTFPVIPAGKVKDDGSFELTSYSEGDGAPEGEYAVTLEWPDPKVNASKGAMPEDPPDRLKNRFANPERSKIKVLIVAGENHLEPIVLEKVEILSGSSLK